MSNTVNVSNTTNQVVITPQSSKTVSVNSGGDTSITVNQGAANSVNISNNIVDTSLTPNTVNITTPPSNGITITDLGTTSVTVNQGITSTVQIASIGPQGPVGPQGPPGPSSGDIATGSLLKTASVVLNTLTFSKGDDSTFDLIVDTGSLEGYATEIYVGQQTSSLSSSLAVDISTNIGDITTLTNASSSFASDILTNAGNITTLTNASSSFASDILTNAGDITTLTNASSSFASNINDLETSSSNTLTTGSVSLNTLTFTKGNGDTFDLIVDTGSAETVDTGSLLTTASVALNTLTFTKGDGTTFPIIVDTGSAETVDTGSLLVTASITDATLTFTKGNSSTFNIEVNNVTSSISASYAQTASYVENAQSASYVENAQSASYVENAQSASYVQLAQTASYVENAQSASYILADNIDQPFTSITASIISASGDLISNTLTAAGIAYPVTDGDDGDVLITDGAGNLSFTRTVVYANVKNVSGGTLAKGWPVHATASAGNASEVIAASASNADTMPATYILAQQLNHEEEGLAILTGYINGVDTSLFEEGQVLYVGADGGYTNVKPTGSNLIQNLGIVAKSAVNGSGYVYGSGRSNDVPNISPGYAWVGNSDSVATAVPTSSFKQYTDSFAMGCGGTDDGATTFGVYPLSLYNETSSKITGKTGASLSSSVWMTRAIPCNDLNGASNININLAGSVKTGTISLPPYNEIIFKLYTASLFPPSSPSDPLNFTLASTGNRIILNSNSTSYFTQSFNDLSLNSNDLVLVAMTPSQNTVDVTLDSVKINVRLSREYTK